MWRGPALADLAGQPWALAHCVRLDELRQVVLEAWVEADLATGRHAELVSELTALVSQYPLREALHAQRMLALYRSGRQADALAAYRQAYDLLAGERGIRPGTALRELERSMLRQDPGLDWRGPPPPPPPRRPPRPPGPTPPEVGAPPGLPQGASARPPGDGAPPAVPAPP